MRGLGGCCGKWRFGRWLGDSRATRGDLAREIPIRPGRSSRCRLDAGLVASLFTRHDRRRGGVGERAGTRCTRGSVIATTRGCLAVGRHGGWVLRSWSREGGIGCCTHDCCRDGCDDQDACCCGRSKGRTARLAAVRPWPPQRCAEERSWRDPDERWYQQVAKQLVDFDDFGQQGAAACAALEVTLDAILFSIREA